ncbi:hypothetical protein ACVOMV_34415 [Mesorhizobium atlanticum]
MGAALDVLRKAAPTRLSTEANGVTDNPLIFAEDDTRASPAAISTPSRWPSPPT